MFRVASPGSLVLFIVPCFTQATFAEARVMKKQLGLPQLLQVDATHCRESKNCTGEAIWSIGRKPSGGPITCVGAYNP